MSANTVSYAPQYDNAGVGVIRANFSSPCSINNNGVVLGTLDVLACPTTSGAFYLNCDTTQGAATPLINVPQGYSNLTLQLTDSTETTLLYDAVPDYEITITFKMLDDENFNGDASFQ